MIPTPGRIAAVLPYLLPALLVVFACVVVTLHRRRAATVPRIILAGVVSVYGVAAVGELFLPFELVVGTARSALAPWPVFVQLVPVATSLSDPSGIVANVVLFLPLGVLVPMVSRVWSVGAVVLVGAAVSLTVEVVQFVLDVTISTGRIADVDDLLGNAAGALVGVLLLRAVLLVPVVRRVVGTAAFPSSQLAGRRGRGGRRSTVGSPERSRTFPPA